jgi:hypothetical protein
MMMVFSHSEIINKFAHVIRVKKASNKYLQLGAMFTAYLYERFTLTYLQSAWYYIENKITWYAQPAVYPIPPLATD